MDSSKEKGSVANDEVATTSRTDAAAPKILPSNKEGGDVAVAALNTLSLAEQNRNNSLCTIYNTTVSSKRPAVQIEKSCITAGNSITASNGPARRNGSLEHSAAKNGAVKGADREFGAKKETQLANKQPWRANACAAAMGYQQYQHQVLARLLQGGYSSSCALPSVAGCAMGNEMFSQNRGKPCCWEGELPPRNYCNPVFSSKVFIGGIPWDTTEPALHEAFAKYGPCRVEWPVKESRSVYPNLRRAKVTGYVYMIFEDDLAVKKLLQDCTQEFGTAGEWYFSMSTRRVGGNLELRQVQIIPWVVTDASYFLNPDTCLDPKKTVFVGALHGMITAQVLFSIMRDVYGDVLFVGIDTDRQKYPIGSARVTFSTQSAYFRAVESRYLEIRTSKFTKKVQIDPFLEDAKCSQCDCVQGPYFCREKSCFKYFCLQCWEVRHALSGPYWNHKPMIRTSRRSLHSTPYGLYGTSATVCHTSSDPRIMPRQLFNAVTPEHGFQMAMRQPVSIPQTEISKQTEIKVAVGQPAYLLSGYPKSPLNQLQIWFPSANQAGMVKQRGSNLNQQTIGSFHRMPYTSPSSTRNRNGENQSEASLRTENLDRALLPSGRASTSSSSAPSSETVSSNRSP